MFTTTVEQNQAPASLSTPSASNIHHNPAMLRLAVPRRNNKTAVAPLATTTTSTSSATPRKRPFYSATLAQELQIDEMLKSLSAEELETAARCSYEYLKSNNGQQRKAYAREMAARYLLSKRETDKALRFMKATIQFRQELDIDGLRQAFDGDCGVSDYSKPLRQHLSNKMVYVQGYDNEGRATYVFEPYRVDSHDDEWTIKQHVWTLERALACTKSHDKTVNAVINFNGFSALRHAPPTSIGTQFMRTLRDHYIGQVNQIFIVDAPTVFLCLWAIFKPLVSVKTSKRIQFVSGNSEKMATIGALYEPKQATPWMLPNGEQDRELDLDEYLLQTSFDRAFNEL